MPPRPPTSRLTLDGTDTLLHGRRVTRCRRTVPPRPRRPHPPRPSRCRSRPYTIGKRRNLKPAPATRSCAPRNDHALEREPSRTLANGDLLRIEADHRRRPGCPPCPGCGPAKPGQHRWTDRRFLYAGYEDCPARLRGHRPRPQGRTWCSRPGFRGHHRHRGPPARLRRPDPRHRHQHRLRVQPCRPKLADPAPGPRPAPRLAQATTSALHRAERQAEPTAAGQMAPGTGDGLPSCPTCWSEMASSSPRLQTWRRALVQRRSPGDPERHLDRRGPPPAREQRCRASCCMAGPACRDTGKSQVTRPNGYGGRRAPPNSPALIPAQHAGRCRHRRAAPDRRPQTYSP